MFHDSLFLYLALLSVPFSALAGIAVYKRFYVGPPVFDEPSSNTALSNDDPDERSMANVGIVGKLGELLTALAMVSDGWRQLPSQIDGVKGIDGIFIRRLRETTNTWSVRLIETKASRWEIGVDDVSDPSQMTDAKVIEQLQLLRNKGHMQKNVADEIIRGVERGSWAVKKELFVHSFSSARTDIYPLDRNGLPIAEGRRLLDMALCGRLLESLEIGLARIATAAPRDPNGVKSIDGVIDRDRVTMQSKTPRIEDNPWSYRHIKAQSAPFVLDYQI